MYEKQIKKSCAAIGTRFLEVYVDSRGNPTADFFRCIARCIGGVGGYRSMSIAALATVIAHRLEIPNLDFKASFVGGPADAWFQAVIPALQVYFHRPNNIIIDSVLPRFSDPEGEEGRRYLALHKKVERNATIVKHLKATSTDRDSLGFIFCRICRAAPGARFGVEVIEAHHVLPVSEAGVRVVKASDFILVCPNCHSSIHAGARVDLPPLDSKTLNTA
jgi:hypothetical protein